MVADVANLHRGDDPQGAGGGMLAGALSTALLLLLHLMLWNDADRSCADAGFALAS